MPSTTSAVITEVLAASSVDDIVGGKAAARIEANLKTVGIIPPPPKVDVAEALASLARVVAAKGLDYVYPKSERQNGSGSCRYVVNGQPSCIVGHVLADLGKLDDNSHVVRDNKSADALADGEIGFSNAGGFTRKAAKLLRAAQLEQDKNQTWGQALAAAYLESAGVTFDKTERVEQPAYTPKPSAYFSYDGPISSPSPYLKPSWF